MVPVPTPCSVAGVLHLENLNRLCHDFRDQGCDSLFVLSSTGRGPWFGADERDQIARAAVDAVGKDVPVFVGCQATGMEPMLELARRAEEQGAAGVVVTAPAYFTYSGDELKRIFLTFADRSPLPVLLYDVPMYTQSRFAEEAIFELARHGRILGLKDTSGDQERFARLATRLIDMPDFYLLQGNEQHLMASLDAGGDGVVSTFCALTPEIFVRMHQAWKSGDRPAALRQEARIRQMYELVVECRARRPAISTLFFLVNRVLERRYGSMNILLEHEGDIPADLDEPARRFVELCMGPHEE
jgi:4-hydroxy-tetrahydrodipicolinate synthase